MTYEANDGSDTCDGLLSGDSQITENALLLGVSFRKSGLFAAVGPARTAIDDARAVREVEESGVRFELGWSSRRGRRSRSVNGVELYGFSVTNDVNAYHGIALNWTIGAAGT